MTQNSDHGSPPPAPERHRRTHTSAAVISVLQGLPLTVKKKKNAEIVERNAERALKRVQHAENPTAYPADASDDESIITLPKEEPSPASALHDAIRNKLSPNSGKTVLRTYGDYRPPDMSLPLVFHSCLIELYTNFIHIPLSVFTSPSLSLINANAPTMDTVKLNAAALGEKQIRVMSTATFEATVLREAEMDGAQWTEAAYNMISFTKKAPHPRPIHAATLTSASSLPSKTPERTFPPSAPPTSLSAKDTSRLLLPTAEIFTTVSFTTRLWSGASRRPCPLGRQTAVRRSYPTEAVEVQPPRVEHAAEEGEAALPSRKATLVPPRPPSAWSVPCEATSTAIATPTPSLTALHSIAPSATATFVLRDPTKHYVGHGTPREPQPPVYTTRPSASTPAHFAVTRIITPSRGPAAPTLPPTNSYKVDSFLASCLPSIHLQRQEILNRICTPYDADAFETLLLKDDLTDRYPMLVRNLRSGFPMGDFPPLDVSVIFANHASTTQHDDFINTHLEEEVAAGRMRGPFTQVEAEAILGTFQSSPITISAQQ
ncbi:hypothetical protein R3P38DRAFT_2768608 [Favolaschia claudopus]|uniref:Uncharacterized protein n=1 Tax=Favolaschia claudopus TaxID=2862362 RepID=A0AAW0CQL4_9AGAR